jgi:2-polyprenyl-6-methoxyphenol hydroxylase-like FAD-dependent oxidoreductase
VGGGIGGLSAGIGLQRAGWEVSVLERMPELHEVGSGLTLWTNAMRALGKLGVADVVQAGGAVIERLENRNWRGEPFATLPIHKIGEKFGAPCVSIHRADLQATLAAALAPGALRLGVQCSGFSQDDRGVTVRLSDGGEQRADLLVGADGIKSTVRAQLFGASPPRYSGYTCWRSAARLEHPGLGPTLYTQLYGPRSTFGIFPIGPGFFSWYGTRMTPAGGGTGKSSPEWKREAQAEFKEWYEPVRAVIDATPEAGVSRQDIYDLKPIDLWSKGRVTLLGDAAHATTPTLGQGGCMAIEDSVVLSRVLAGGGDVSACLRDYSDQRFRRANGIVRQARRHGVLYHAANPLLETVRHIFLKRAPVSIAMREVEKLMGYEA